MFSLLDLPWHIDSRWSYWCLKKIVYCWWGKIHDFELFCFKMKNEQTIGKGWWWLWKWWLGWWWWCWYEGWMIDLKLTLHREDTLYPTMGWVQICEPLFLRFWAPFKILVLLALHIKNIRRKVYLNMCGDVRCELESPFFYTFECHSKFFF